MMDRKKLAQNVLDHSSQIMQHYIDGVDDERLLHDTEDFIEALLEMISYDDRKEFRVRLSNSHLI
jgi:hypothetical protein